MATADDLPEAFAEELDRRLTTLEDPRYDDPARTNLSTLDFVALLVLNVAVVAVMYAVVWGGGS